MIFLLLQILIFVTTKGRNKLKCCQLNDILSISEALNDVKFNDNKCPIPYNLTLPFLLNDVEANQIDLEYDVFLSCIRPPSLSDKK